MVIASTEKTKCERCIDCPLAGKSAVGAKGNIASKVIFIGEAPGLDEIHTGIPFTGPSGKLFDMLCRTHNITDMYVTNALKCPQPKNQTAVNKQTILTCHDRLIDEITAYPRDLIVCMGATALKSVTSNMSAKITRMRGRVFETEYGLAIATFHPAAILRNVKEYRTLVQDFRYIGEIVNNGNMAIKSPGKVHYEIANEDNVSNWITFLRKHTYLGADIETTGYNAYRDEIMCLGIAYAKNKVVIFPKSLIRKEILRDLFDYKENMWIWHNGKFDTKFLRNLGINARIDEDVMLMHYILDERPGTHDLKQLANVFLGATDYEKKIKPYITKIDGNDSFAHIPEALLFEYLANDCDVTLQLWHKLRPEFTNNSNYMRAYYHILIPASEFLQDVENAGMRINVDYMHGLEQSLNTRIDNTYTEIMDIAQKFWDAETYTIESGAKKIPEEFNPASPKQLKWLLYSKRAMGIKVPKGFPDNTAESTLAALPENPFVNNILSYRGDRKSLNTYVLGTKEQLNRYTDGRIHPSFLLHTVETGRLSSREPNAQNFPRGTSIRNLIVASDGNIFIEADYSQAELRGLAWYSNDPFLIDVYATGKDLHDVVAQDFYPNWLNEQDIDVKREQRVDAKSINFGIAYGKTAASFSKERNMSIEQAQYYINRWFARAYKAKEFLEYCENIGVSGGTLKTPFGRHRRFGFVNYDNRIHVANEARNFPIQSLASDLTLLAAMELHKNLLPKYNAKIVNIVHDSILIETPYDKELVNLLREDIVNVMRNTPIKYIGDRVPFDADTKIGFSWGNLHE